MGRSLSPGSDPAAVDLDRQVQALAGSPQLAQEVYALAAQVFADLLWQRHGIRLWCELEIERVERGECRLEHRKDSTGFFLRGPLTLH